MNGLPIGKKDISLLTALKPFLSPQGQEFVEIVVNVVRIFNPEEQGNIDTEALASLVEILNRHTG